MISTYQNTPRPSGHEKHLVGGIKGYSYIITSSWDPMEITLSQQYNIREKPTVIHYVKLQKQVRNYIINQLPSLVFKITTTIIYQYFILPVGFDAACNFSFPLPLTTLLYYLVYGVFF